MLVWLMVGAALAAPDERISRLYEKQEWGRTHDACTKAAIAQSDDTETRALCAEAERIAAPPADNVTALLSYSTRWAGTEQVRATFARAAELALPPDGAGEAALLRHHKKFVGTDSARVSLARAEQAAVVRARQAGTVAAWADVLTRYPEGALRADTVTEAAQAADRVARSTGESTPWHTLFAVAPDATRELAHAADSWALSVVATQLDGPCWASPCASIASGDRVSIAELDLPHGFHLEVRWVARSEAGGHISEAELGRALGLERAELERLTTFQTGLGLVHWTAPVGWAQPPDALGALWELELSMGTATPITVPFQGAHHWRAAGEGGQAVAHWSPAGLWIHGPTGSARWADGPKRGATGPLAATETHLFAAAGSSLTVVPRAGGAVHQLTVPFDVVGLSRAGEALWVAGAEAAAVCTESGCEATPLAGSVDPVSGNRLSLVEDEGALRWHVSDPSGRLLAAPRMPSASPGPLGTAASFDATGEHLLVVVDVAGEDSHLLRVVDVGSGAVVAEKRYARASARYGAQTAAGVRAVVPTSAADTWRLATAASVDAPDRSVAVRAVGGGRLVVRPLADATAVAWFEVTGDADQVPPALDRSLVGSDPLPDVLRTASPDGHGFVSGTMAQLPGGRTVPLPGAGAHLWLDAPLSLRLQVAADQ